jgi:hypothetical protein
MTDHSCWTLHGQTDTPKKTAHSTYQRKLLRHTSGTTKLNSTHKQMEATLSNCEAKSNRSQSNNYPNPLFIFCSRQKSKTKSNIFSTIFKRQLTQQNKIKSSIKKCSNNLQYQGILCTTPWEEEETRKPSNERNKPRIQNPSQNKLLRFCTTVSSSTESLLTRKPTTFYNCPSLTRNLPPKQ